jgi:5'-nucleotidase
MAGLVPAIRAFLCRQGVDARHKAGHDAGGGDMRILVTNDDGIHAPGLQVCADIAHALSDDVWVVAPEVDNSGVSHSLSLNDPLRLRHVSERVYAVKGTPTDCVIMAARHILKDQPPDLVLSGVNRGSNLGEDVTYSGTVAGAMEGTVLGIPSFALSQSYGPGRRDNPFWDCARKHAPDVVRRILEAGIPNDVLVNVNFPDCAPADVQGIAVSSQGKRDQEMLRIDARFDGRGNPYYWLAYTRSGVQSTRAGTDLVAVAQKKIAVTPLRLDLTDEPFMTKLAEVFG